MFNLYIFDMKNEAKNWPISKALSKWREKQPSLVKKTVLDWIEDGLIDTVMETHGIFKWHTFTKEEVMRVYRLLRTDWKPGEPVLPRPEK